MKNLQFPDEFLWGAATSSHQIEGGQNNDWTRWEKIEGKIKDNKLSGKAANSWELYEKDFDLLEEMNLKSYRFSIEWSRIEPERGKFDQQAISKYRRMLESLKERGITPFVTLHHFTNPPWLKDWSHKENVEYYELYVEFIVASLGEHVKYWTTINEPNVFTDMGFIHGPWPPGKRNPPVAYKVLKNLHKAHKKAYHMIHEIYEHHRWEQPMVGISVNLQHVEYLNNKRSTKVFGDLAKYFSNDYTLVRVHKYLDFIGVNYYFSHWVDGFSWDNDPQELPKNDLGWALYPEGLRGVLNHIKKYSLPIYITESGVADSTDKLRMWYLPQCIKQVHLAMLDGVDVRGYMHWSLIDNFEWADGYTGRFGLAAVNFTNFKRTLRDSGHLYGQIVRDNSLPDVLPEIQT